VTLREEVERLLDQLSKPGLETEYWRLQRAVASEGHVDEWGDLSDWSDAVCRGTFDHLDEAEAAIGFSWEKYREHEAR
jgi:hypothetical protein